MSCWAVSAHASMNIELSVLRGLHTIYAAPGCGTPAGVKKDGFDSVRVVSIVDCMPLLPRVE